MGRDLSWLTSHCHTPNSPFKALQPWPKAAIFAATCVLWGAGTDGSCTNHSGCCVLTYFHVSGDTVKAAGGTASGKTGTCLGTRALWIPKATSCWFMHQAVSCLDPLKTKVDMGCTGLLGWSASPLPCILQSQALPACLAACLIHPALPQPPCWRPARWAPEALPAPVGLPPSPQAEGIPTAPCKRLKSKASQGNPKTETLLEEAFSFSGTRSFIAVKAKVLSFSVPHQHRCPLLRPSGQAGFPVVSTCALEASQLLLVGTADRSSCCQLLPHPSVCFLPSELCGLPGSPGFLRARRHLDTRSLLSDTD